MWILVTLIIILYLTCENCHGIFRLEDLQKPYLKAYPKRQHMSPNFTKGAPNVNTQGFNSIWRRCQEPSYFSPAQFQQLKDYYGQELVLTETIKDMLYQSRGRFFNGNNNKSTFEDYHIALAGSGGCFNLKTPKFGLVETWGKCTRAFQYPDCFGWTLAIYPGSPTPTINMIVVKFTQIRSIGPCLTDEFSSSSLKPNNEVEVGKNPQYKDHNPDLIELPQNSIKHLRLRLDNGKKGISHGIFKSGPKNQMHNILVRIGNGNIDESQTTNTWKSKGKFPVNETEEGDVLIYVIPPKFGGPTNQSWNVFLGTKSVAEHWGNVSSSFPYPSTDFESLGLALGFTYEQVDGIRPLFFYYSAWANGFISYGRVMNGHQDNLLSPQVIDYSTETNVLTMEEEKRVEVVRPLFFERPDRLNKVMMSEEVSRSGNYTIRNVNHAENRVWKCSVETRSFLAQFQESYLTNDSEKMKAQSWALEKMVVLPNARFYSGVNYTGDFEEFAQTNISKLGFCYKLDKLKNRVESIASFGSCIRIFMSPLCMGQSLVIYPPSMNNTLLSQYLREINLKEIESVGPCLWGEMSHSTFTPNHDFVPKIIFPPYITFYHLGKEKVAEDVSHGSIILYNLGTKNRTEFIAAYSEPEKYLYFENFHKDQFPVCFKNEEGKPFCYAVPHMLNGPQDQPYNIFEASQDAMEVWVEYISDLFMKKHGQYLFALNFQYDNVNSTKPTWIFYYCYSQVGGITYGQLYNGLRGNSSNYPRGNRRTVGYWDGYNLITLLRNQH